VKRFASPCSLDSLDTGDLDIRARCSKTVRSRKQTFPRHRTTVPPADTGRPPRRIPREAVQRASPVRRDVLLPSARYRFISTHRKKVHTVRSRPEWGTHSLRSWNRPPCDLLSATLSSETLKGLFELRTGLYIVGPSVRVRSVRPPRGACRTANTDTPPTTRRTGSSPCGGWLGGCRCLRYGKRLVEGAPTALERKGRRYKVPSVTQRALSASQKKGWQKAGHRAVDSRTGESGSPIRGASVQCEPFFDGLR